METVLYTVGAMAKRTRPRHASTDTETFGQRLARLRKERGYTQVELAERVSLVQTLISDYERDKLRLNAELVVRFAAALEITTDELLWPKEARTALRRKPSLRMLRRLERIESLPTHQQATLLKTIDTFLRGASAAR